jgi:hypothetical protein
LGHGAAKLSGHGRAWRTPRSPLLSRLNSSDATAH